MLLESLTLAQILQNNPTQNIQPPPEPIPIVEQLKPEKKKPVVYTVKKGDTLTKVSKKYKLSVKRLWSANRQVKHQDILNVGTKLKVPAKSDKLKARAFVQPESVKYTASTNTPITAPIRGSGGLNTYQAGQCVWYVKNRKPSVPNGWGDATNWKNAATQAGWTVSSKPIGGAVGWVYGHVVYVEKVNNNGTVTISEMNYDWVPYHQRTITVSVSKYIYLY